MHVIGRPPSLNQHYHTIKEGESFHDLHTWMTSSYMTYITRYTVRLLPVSHPNREGQHITGVYGPNAHTRTHTMSHKQACHQDYTWMHDHKNNLSLYLPQIRPHRTHALLGINMLMYCTPVVLIWWLQLCVIKMNGMGRFRCILIGRAWVFKLGLY